MAWPPLSLAWVLLTSAGLRLVAGTPDPAGISSAAAKQPGSLPAAAGGQARVPVLYCTDLFHPHDDPDDHFDLATLYALPALDLKGIVLDQGEKQLLRPGRIPVSQLNHLAGREVPAALGLATPLRSPQDQGLDQPAQFQEGVRLILETLRQSDVPVAMITVGSVRDLVAAYNREPDLVRRQTGRLLCFIGEASREDFREYNVGLDPEAYVGLMRSDLPVFWVPCFDGGPWHNGGHASFWKAKHARLLEEAPAGLIQFFIYALELEQADPIGFLSRPVDPARRARLFAGERNLWCTAIFGSVTGRTVPGEGGRELFGFEEVEVTVTDSGVVKCGPGPGGRKLQRFVVRDQAEYAEGMTRATAALLESFPTP